jgi:hypothetical protein
MISDHLAVQIVSGSVTRRTLHWSLVADRVSTLAAPIQRLAGVMTSFATVPVLPHASLLEASVVVAFIEGADRAGSDSLADRSSSIGDDGFWSGF